MRIAIIGSGISGLVTAYHLSKNHDTTVFESNKYIGGHTHTHQITLGSGTYAVDSGFIVFNDWTYPNFIHLLNQLGVEHQPSSMSFSVKCERTGLEYNGTSLNSLFAQRRNLFNPSFLRMIVDIMRFNKQAPALIESGNDQTTLGEYLSENRYSRSFIENYILPMGSAIWSTDPEQMLGFPASFFVRFFHNHGMLNIDNRPVWRVIKGGSHSYVKALTRQFSDHILLETPIQQVTRLPTSVQVKTINGDTDNFDAVIFACHSDQALKILTDPSPTETEILGAIPYQENEAILHTDSKVLPKKQLAWAAWNYHIPKEKRYKVALTYNMNILQNLDAHETICVSLNYDNSIDPNQIIKRIMYHHPLYTPAGIAAQKRHKEISGINNTYYCGAYWGFGFHEDGVNSALRVVSQIEGE